MKLLGRDCTDAGDDSKNKNLVYQVTPFFFGDCYCFLKNLPIQKLGISFNLVLRVITTKPIRFQILYIFFLH